MTLPLIIAVFAAGVIVGLIIGPSSEREFSARIDGWVDGYRFGVSARAKDSSK